MKRFYIRGIKALREELDLREIADDIDLYVEHLEFVKGILVSEVGRAKSANGRHLLRQLGYQIPYGSEGKEDDHNEPH